MACATTPVYALWSDAPTWFDSVPLRAAATHRSAHRLGGGGRRAPKSSNTRCESHTPDNHRFWQTSGLEVGGRGAPSSLSGVLGIRKSAGLKVSHIFDVWSVADDRRASSSCGAASDAWARRGSLSLPDTSSECLLWNRETYGRLGGSVGRPATALGAGWAGGPDKAQGGPRGLDVGRGGLAFGVRMLLFLAFGVVGMGCR